MRMYHTRCRVSDRELLIFTRHLGALLGAGLPIISALSITADRCANKTLADALSKARERIANGSTLSDSLGESPRIFTPYFRSLVKAGESAGILEESLTSLARDIDNRVTLREHLISAAIYPAVVVCALLLITLFLVASVIPTFEELFSDLGAPLPTLTQVVLSMSRLLTHYGALVLPCVAIIGALTLESTRRNQELATRIERLLLRTPLIGSILTLTWSARMSGSFAALLRSGIPIIEALTTTANVVVSRVFSHEIRRIRDAVVSGSSLSSAMRESAALPPILIDYISVGERSGRLEEMMNTCAAQLERDLAALISRMKQLVEPALILSVGVVVGTLVLAMYLPIFQIGGLIAH